MQDGRNWLVGAKYVGWVCTGLASAFSWVSRGGMSIPRNLVCSGRKDPRSSPISSATAVAGAKGAVASSQDESVVLDEFMDDSSCNKNVVFFVLLHQYNGVKICSLSLELSSSCQLNTLQASGTRVTLEPNKRGMHANQVNAGKLNVDMYYRK